MLISSKTLKSLALATIAIAAPAVAHAGTDSEVRHFTRNGVKYQYTSVVEGNREVLSGTADGVPFRLVVRGNSVSGYNGSYPVEFTYRAAKKPAPAEIVAAR